MRLAAGGHQGGGRYGADTDTLAAMTGRAGLC